MCNTSKMLVLFFILFIIQSKSIYGQQPSEYRNEPFVFVKPNNRELSSHSEKSDIYNRNKRQKLEQIRARHENKLTVNTDKYDIGADISKILLDNKDAEIFHNKNINVKRSAKFKSKVNKNKYDKFGYIYANEEEDSMKENMDSVPKKKHDNKHPFEKLILKKIKAYDIPLSKKKGYRKNGFSRKDKRLRLKGSYMSNLRQNNAEFIPNLLELQKYRADLNKAEADNSTASPTIPNDDYAEDGPVLEIEKEASEPSTVTESVEYDTECIIIGATYTEYTAGLITNKTESMLPTTEYITKARKSNDEVITKGSTDKIISTLDYHKISSVTDPSKNISTFNSSKTNSTFDLTTQNVSVTASSVTIPDTPSTTCQICFTLFPSFGSVVDENGDNNSTVTNVSVNNTTSTSSGNFTSTSSGNITSTSSGNITNTLNSNTSTSDFTMSATSKSANTSNDKQSTASILTTEDGNHTGKSQRLTKRNLSGFEYNLFESVGIDITNGNNLMQDKRLTTCVEVTDLLSSGLITENLQSSDATTEGNLQTQAATDENLVSETTDTTCMTVFRYTVPERVKTRVTIVATVPQTESVSPVKPTGIVANLTATSSPVYISYTEQEKAIYNISSTTSKVEEIVEASTSSASLITETLTTKTDVLKLDQLSTSNVTTNVSLLLSHTVSPLMLPNTTSIYYKETPIINYTYPSVQTEQEYITSPVSTLQQNVTTEFTTIVPLQYITLPASTLQNVTTECTTIVPLVSSTIQPQHQFTPPEKLVQPTSVPLPAVVSVLNATQNETMTTKHGFVMKLPHIKLPLINKTQQTTELPICTEKFTIFPLKINTTISKLAVYTFRKAAMRSESPCVYASVITKKTKKPKVPQSTIRLILSQPTLTPAASELAKPSAETLSQTLQHLTSQTAPSDTHTSTMTCITVFKYTVPPRVSAYTIKPPAFQQSVTPSIPSEGVTEPSVVTLSTIVQQSAVKSKSNPILTTLPSYMTTLKHTIQPLEYTVQPQPPTIQQLMPLTTVSKLSVVSSELTVKPSVPESAPSEAPTPSTIVPSPPSVKQVVPEITSEGVQSAATTCMTVFKYTVPPPVDRITVRVPADQQLTLTADQQLILSTDQQVPPQTTTWETVSHLSPVSNHQHLLPQTTPSAGDKPIPSPPMQILGPSGTQKEPCIPVPVLQGRAKGSKKYPIRHKGGDPGNSYYRKQQAATKRFSIRPLLCTTIKFVECTTQYQPMMQRILQNTEKVFIPKAIATKAETQTCKPESSDCSSCDFGNALPEMLPNKVELPPNPMPPVNLDFPTGNNDTNCVDLNQILNFTSAP